MSPIPIVYVIDSMGRGGTELQLAGLIARLDRRRFAPSLVTLRHFDAGVLPADCPHTHLGTGSFVSPRTLVAVGGLARRLRRDGTAIVQTYFQDGTIFGGTAARLAGTPVRIASFRDMGFWRTPGKELVLRRIYGAMTGFVANSPAVRDDFCRRDGLDPARVTVIPNGIEVERIAFAPPRQKPVVVGIVGNLNRPVKRIDLFIEAAGILHRDHPQARWEIVGDGPLRPELEGRARALGLGAALRFHGRVPDAAGLVAGWDVGVLCSDSEGFSNALLEYMLAGAAVVATDVGGNREAIDHGNTGLLVPAGDAEALAAAIGALLADGALAGRLALAAAAEARARYGWERCVQAHEELYAQLLADADPGSRVRTSSPGRWTRR